MYINAYVSFSAVLFCIINEIRFFFFFCGHLHTLLFLFLINTTQRIPPPPPPPRDIMYIFVCVCVCAYTYSFYEYFVYCIAFVFFCIFYLMCARVPCAALVREGAAAPGHSAQLLENKINRNDCYNNNTVVVVGVRVAVGTQYPVTRRTLYARNFVGHSGIRTYYYNRRCTGDCVLETAKIKYKKKKTKKIHTYVRTHT